jgi:hypothetical protein
VGTNIANAMGSCHGFPICVAAGNGDNRGAATEDTCPALSAIKEIRINVNAATTHLPDGTEKQYWRPDTDTARFADGLADHIHESWYDYVDRALHHQGPDNWDRLENWEHIGEGLRVLLSRVGRLETRADEGVWEIDMDEMMEWLEAICARR